MDTVTRTQIIQKSSWTQLQKATNIYIDNIQRAGAQIIGTPKIQIIKRSPQDIRQLKDKIRKYYIHQNNLKTTIKLSLNTSISALKKEYMGKLANKILTMQNKITTYVYYEQICYKVSTWFYKSNHQDFS